VPKADEKNCKSSLFSSTYDTRSWCRLVEICGALLKLEALDSYKIIYSFGVRTPLAAPCYQARPARALGVLPAWRIRTCDLPRVLPS
jgi:hypothetical protein